MSYNHNKKEHSHLCKFLAVEIGSYIRPACVAVLSFHESKEDAIEAWKSSAVANIDFYDIPHSILEI